MMTPRLAFLSARLPAKARTHLTGNRVVPAFGLYVDVTQAKPVLLDDAVYTIITAPSHGLACIAYRAPVAHSDEQLNDQALKEGR